MSNGRIQREAAGFFVIKPESGNTPIPLFCPLCKLAMKNYQDAQYYRKWEACYNCSTMYAEPNRKIWVTGWRPVVSCAGE